MNDITELKRKCLALPFSLNGDVTGSAVSDTGEELKELCGEYGNPSVFSTLAEIWPVEKAVAFFSRANVFTHVKHAVATVAVSYFRGYNGGVERVNAELMELWINMGYKVVFFTDEPENSKDYPYPAAVVRIIVPSFNDIGARLDAVYRHCVDERVDLFINHKWTESRTIWENLLVQSMGIYYLNYCHGHFSICFANGKAALCQPAALGSADLVIALSETNARFYQMCGCRTFLVQNPIPHELIRSSSPSPLSSGHVLLIGRLAEEKNPFDALQIFKIVLEKHPGAVLDIVGDGSEEIIRAMKAFISENCMDHAVVFHGLKTASEIPDYYKMASCLLFTSRMEGYPMTVLESKAFGLPLIMYDLPFLTLTRDGKGVLSAEAGDICTMADHVIRVLKNSDYRKKLGREARESFESFAGYDLEAAWREIFEICTGDQTKSEAYFSPEDLSNTDRLIMPSLLDKISEGYSNTFSSSHEYKLGSLLLRFPRRMKRLLNKR